MAQTEQKIYDKNYISLIREIEVALVFIKNELNVIRKEHNWKIRQGLFGRRALA